MAWVLRLSVSRDASLHMGLSCFSNLRSTRPLAQSSFARSALEKCVELAEPAGSGDSATSAQTLAAWKISGRAD